MVSRRKDRDDIIGPSTGWMKWINKFFRFVLYPFIHPIWFITGVVVFAVVIVGLPSYYGVEFKDIPQWYKEKFDVCYTKAMLTIEKVELSKIEQNVGFDDMKSKVINVVKVEKQPGKDELIAYETPQMINRRAFQKAQEVPVDVKATLERKYLNEGVPYFKRNDSLGLVYLELPKKIVGKAKIVNANELKINNEVVFLYGIYSDPLSSEGIMALQYLQENIDGKEIDCFVGAYTSDGMSTAICLYDGLNINQRLVDLKYSKDVSLN